MFKGMILAVVGFVSIAAQAAPKTYVAAECVASASLKTRIVIRFEGLLASDGAMKSADTLEVAIKSFEIDPRTGKEIGEVTELAMYPSDDDTDRIANRFFMKQSMSGLSISASFSPNWSIGPLGAELPAQMAIISASPSRSKLYSFQTKTFIISKADNMVFSKIADCKQFDSSGNFLKF